MKEVKPASNPHNRSFQGCLDEIEKLEDEMKQIARYLNDPVRIALSPRLRAKLILLAKEEHQDIDARLDRIMERL